MTIRRACGFTLIEVLVALGIVAIALATGLKASGALAFNAQRQSDGLLAQMCAENQLVAARLSRQMPGVGESSFTCEQAGRTFNGKLTVLPTPNPNFLRLDAQVLDGQTPLLRLSTILGRF
jgi:general secretion pathway protein I